MRVLVVDDSVVVQKAVSRVLGRLLPSVEVHFAEDLATARDVYRGREPSIVFLDLVLGAGSDGTEFLSELARAKHESYVVVLTGLPRDSPEVVKALSLGAFAHLAKPVRTDEVRDVLRTIELETGAA